MITAQLSDKLQKDVSIIPSIVKFGNLKAGNDTCYEFRIRVKNMDHMAQRITLRQPKSPHVRVGTKKFGLIASGMTREIFVRI